MEKILVTGGAGFIGSHIVDSLIDEGHEVIIIDNLSTGRKININLKARFYDYDLSNYDKIKEIFNKEKPTIIYHLAAQISVRNSVENPLNDAKQNILNTLNLLDLSAKNNLKRFIFSSTGGAIYGDKKVPSSEKDAAEPISPYGCAKLSIEKYLNFYKEVYGLKFTILRYSNVYGPRQNPHGEAGVIAIFIKKILEGEKITIFGGLQTRDFVYVGDVVNANILALNDNKSEIYNVGTGIETDIIDIFGKMSKISGYKQEANFLPKKKGEQMRSCLDCKNIKMNLNWRPLTSLNEGLELTYLWFLRNKHLI